MNPPRSLRFLPDRRARPPGAAGLVLLLALMLAPFGLAQIGSPPGALVEALGGAAVDGWYVPDEDFRYRLELRGDRLYALEAEGTFDAEARALAARAIGLASGFGAGIEEPVRAFLGANLGELSGRGPSRVAVEQYQLELDVAEGEAPYAGRLRFELTRVPAEAFPEPAAALGPADAPYVVREFSDFQCPFCAQFAAGPLEEIKSDLLPRGDVRFEYHHFPLQSIHPNALPAAEASECVRDVAGSDAFWSFHDALFERQRAWQGLGDPTPYFARTAGDLGFDAGAVEACLEERRFADAVRADYDAAVALRLSGTPTLFVNGLRVTQPGDVAAYARLIDLVDAFAEPATTLPAPASP